MEIGNYYVDAMSWLWDRIRICSISSDLLLFGGFYFFGASSIFHSGRLATSSIVLGVATPRAAVPGTRLLRVHHGEHSGGRYPRGDTRGAVQDQGARPFRPRRPRSDLSIPHASLADYGIPSLPRRLCARSARRARSSPSWRTCSARVCPSRASTSRTAPTSTTRAP